MVATWVEYEELFSFQLLLLLPLFVLSEWGKAGMGVVLLPDDPEPMPNPKDKTANANSQCQERRAFWANAMQTGSHKQGCVQIWSVHERRCPDFLDPPIVEGIVTIVVWDERQDGHDQKSDHRRGFHSAKNVDASQNYGNHDPKKRNRIVGLHDQVEPEKRAPAIGTERIKSMNGRGANKGKWN